MSALPGKAAVIPKAEAMVGDDALAYETRPNHEYGKTWAREVGRHASPKGNARKCQFCLHRIENGLLPACVTTGFLVGCAAAGLFYMIDRRRSTVG